MPTIAPRTPATGPQIVLSADEIAALVRAAELLRWIAVAEFDISGSGEQTRLTAESITKIAMSARHGTGRFATAA